MLQNRSGLTRSVSDSCDDAFVDIHSQKIALFRIEIEESQELGRRGIKGRSNEAIEINPSVGQGTAQQYVLGGLVHVIDSLRY